MAALDTDWTATLARALRVEPGTPARLRGRDTADTCGLARPKDSAATLREITATLSEYQRRLAAADTDALLVVLQAMDAAGKDGAIRHIFSGVNPQGVRVTSFKAPVGVELEHDYLWRHEAALPERGTIGVFNRSHYEEVLVVRVHPELLERRGLVADDGVWERRFDEINAFERRLAANRVHVVKIFLHLSREEQRERFLARLEEPSKHWKFSAVDVRERVHWDRYQEAYEDALTRTSTAWAPWHVVPADRKWFARIAVASLVVEALRRIDPRYPTMSPEDLAELRAAEAELRAGG